MTLDIIISDMLKQYNKQKVIDFLECTRYIYSCQYYCYNDLDALDLAFYIDEKIKELGEANAKD